MADNPITRPMTTLLDRSVAAATWLRDAAQYDAQVALARLIAGQIDDAVEQNKVDDPEFLKQFHMRMVPNLQRALFTLGLTPEGYAKMTGVGSVSGQTSGKEAAGSTASAPAGVATPFDAAAATASADPLAELINLEDRRTGRSSPS